MTNAIRVDDLAEIERRVVMPVVRALLRDDELDSVKLTFDTPDGSWPFPPEPGSVWLTLVAVGEAFWHVLVWSSADREQAASADADEEPSELAPWEDDAAGMAANLYDQLWDWVVETRFSWGEPRDGDYVIPPPQADPASTQDRQ